MRCSGLTGAAWAAPRSSSTLVQAAAAAAPAAQAVRGSWARARCPSGLSACPAWRPRQWEEWHDPSSGSRAGARLISGQRREGRATTNGGAGRVQCSAAHAARRMLRQSRMNLELTCPSSHHPINPHHHPSLRVLSRRGARPAAAAGREQQHSGGRRERQRQRKRRCAANR